MNFIKCKLTKLESTNENLRTNEIIGETNKLPEVGFNFHIVSTPIDKSFSYRKVSTSEVQYVIKEENFYIFDTHNSKYKLETSDI